MTKMEQSKLKQLFSPEMFITDNVFELQFHHLFTLYPTPKNQVIGHEIQTNLLRYEIRVVDVFLQFGQDLRLDIVLVIVCQTPEEIGISQ